MITLHKDDLETLLQIMDKINPVENLVTLEHDSSSGIGQLVRAHFAVDHNGVKGTLTTTLVDESRW